MRPQQINSEPRGWRPSWRNLEQISVHEVGRPRLRKSNPIYAGNLEGITQALYDIYFLAVATAAPKLTMFSNPVGQVYNFGGVTAFAKTFNHTNLTQPGMLEAPNKHIIRAISVYVQGLQGATTNANGGPLCNPIDMTNLAATYFQFNINRKSYQDTIVGRLPAGGGVTINGSVSNTTAATTTAMIQGVNGWQVRDNTYALAYGGVPLEQAQNFNAIIDPTAAAGGAWTSCAANLAPVIGTGISAWVIFDGTLFRAVQ
jgi:hypothetical protein